MTFLFQLTFEPFQKRKQHFETFEERVHKSQSTLIVFSKPIA